MLARTRAFHALEQVAIGQRCAGALEGFEQVVGERAALVAAEIELLGLLLRAARSDHDVAAAGQGVPAAASLRGTPDCAELCRLGGLDEEGLDGPDALVSGHAAVAHLGLRGGSACPNRSGSSRGSRPRGRR